jgi:hypothetical protein
MPSVKGIELMAFSNMEGCERATSAFPEFGHSSV